MRLPHRLQGQKVKSQGGAVAYCGGDLAAQLVTLCDVLWQCKLTCISHRRECIGLQEVQLSQSYRMTLRIIEYFTQGHSRSFDTN